MVSQQFTCCICLPKARVPTEGPERREVIDKGQSAYRRTRASRSYRQRPEVPTEGPERQESYQQRPECQNGMNNKKRLTGGKPHADRTSLYDGSTYEHQQSWGSWRPNSRGQQATRKRANETPYQNDTKMQEADHKTTYDETITTPNAR